MKLSGIADFWFDLVKIKQSFRLDHIFKANSFFFFAIFRELLFCFLLWHIFRKHFFCLVLFDGTWTFNYYYSSGGINIISKNLKNKTFVAFLRNFKVLKPLNSIISSYGAISMVFGLPISEQSYESSLQLLKQRWAVLKNTSYHYFLQDSHGSDIFKVSSRSLIEARQKIIIKKNRSRYAVYFRWIRLSI